LAAIITGKNSEGIPCGPDVTAVKPVAGSARRLTRRVAFHGYTALLSMAVPGGLAHCSEPAAKVS